MATTMDNAQKHKFIQIFDNLPEQVRDAYNEAHRKPGQQRLTAQLINSAIERKRSTLLPVETASQWPQEAVCSTRSKYKDDYGIAMIFEEAQAERDGSQHLDRVIAAWHAKIAAIDAGIALDYRPRSRIVCSTKETQVQTSAPT